MSNHKRRKTTNNPNIVITDSEVRINQGNYSVPNQDKSSQHSKANTFLSILLAFCTISGITCVGVWQYFKNSRKDNISSVGNSTYTEVETTAFETVPDIKYEVYLKPDYNRTSVNIPLDINVETNFNAASVSLTANLDSGKTDILNMNKIGENKWELKVQFYESGIHEIFATAKIDDEKIESLPVNITVDDFNIDDIEQNQFSDFFEMLY